MKRTSYNTNEESPIPDKYLKYQQHFKVVNNSNATSNTIFWGLGIENELYLEFQKKHTANKLDLINNVKRERYSVDYYKSYNFEDYQDAITNYIAEISDCNVTIPILLNAHSFVKTDKNNEPKNRYTKLCEPNSKFCGETLIETLQKENPYFEISKDREWLFDGDTVEFNTLAFYNAQLETVIEELSKHKAQFIYELNHTCKKIEYFPKYGELQLMEQNHPFATYMTNFQQMSMFNNGTLHFNITLPSHLNEHGKIADMDTFISKHRKGIKIIQWMEPFLISMYGSPDPFSTIDDYPNAYKFSSASQRCAISRYIGVGIYDTDTMERGKCLTKPIAEMDLYTLPYWWFHEYYVDNAYVKLKEIGYDINFNKYNNHGIELRFLDHMSDVADIYESFEFLIYCMDIILENDDIQSFGNPIKTAIWNEFVTRTLIFGKNYMLTHMEKALYENLFDITLHVDNFKLVDVYYEIYGQLKTRYTKCTIDNGVKTVQAIGPFSKFAIRPKHTICETDYPDIDIPDDDDETSGKKDDVASLEKRACCTIM